MKIKLPNSLIKIALNSNSMRINMSAQNPVPDIPVDVSPSLDFSRTTNSQYIPIIF